MGVMLMILGLASAGLVADFFLENAPASAPVESFTVLGSSFRASVPALVLGAFVGGALMLILIRSGMALMRQRRTRRRNLKRRVADLERENATLRIAKNDYGWHPVNPSKKPLPASWMGRALDRRGALV